jgi:hypothetical protein
LVAIRRQRSLIPARLNATLEGEMLRVELDLADMDLGAAELVVAKIGEGVLTLRVSLNPAVTGATWSPPRRTEDERSAAG